MHEHDHEHDHNHHEHDHEHHDHDCDCGHSHGEIEITITLHDEAVIASGASILQCANPERVKNALCAGLEAVAIAVDENDGIIGHIKSSFQVTTTQIMSLTEPGVAMDTRIGEAVECRIGAAAIVFGVQPELLKSWLHDAFERALHAAEH